MQLSNIAAKNLLIAVQGLDCRSSQPPDKDAVLATIQKMGALQIDTIHVVARSPYLVLWSRLGDYQPHWLEELLAEGAIFEYWAHEACFLPIEDYALFRHRMLNAAQLGWKYSQEWVAEHQHELSKVLAHIRTNGPARSVDFERTDGRGGGWWEWKPEKRALEMLFSAGELMVARRERFQRVYDLRERVHAGWDDAHLPTLAEVEQQLIVKSVKALGVTTARWIADYFRMEKKGINAAVKRLVEQELLISVTVEDWTETGYLHADNLALAGSINDDNAREPVLTTLLSPFDPLVWDRARALALFNFDYRLECYTPAPKRIYGYFTLPILHRGQLIGRLDAKAHRKEKIMEIKALYLEPGVKVTEPLIDELAVCLKEFANWHHTPEVLISQSEPARLAKKLTQRLKKL